MRLGGGERGLFDGFRERGLAACTGTAAALAGSGRAAEARHRGAVMLRGQGRRGTRSCGARTGARPRGPAPLRRRDRAPRHPVALDDPGHDPRVHPGHAARRTSRASRSTRTTCSASRAPGATCSRRSTTRRNTPGSRATWRAGGGGSRAAAWTRAIRTSPRPNRWCATFCTGTASSAGSSAGRARTSSSRTASASATRFPRPPRTAACAGSRRRSSPGARRSGSRSTSGSGRGWTARASWPP